jgi:hypothetical protein
MNNFWKSHETQELYGSKTIETDKLSYSHGLQTHVDLPFDPATKNLMPAFSEFRPIKDYCTCALSEMLNKDMNQSIR